MIQVHPIFQTPIFTVELDGLTDAHGLDDYIQSMCDRTPGTYGPGEVVQSRYDLNRDPKLGPLCDALFEIMHTISRDVYKYDESYTVEMTSMWGNSQRPGSAFTSHVHYNNLFSGVFYLNDDAEFPPITFWRPSDTTLDPRKSEYNVLNQGSFRVPTKKDLAVIFPAWLHHSVGVNQASTNRLGISFNMMLRGEYYNTVL